MPATKFTTVASFETAPPAWVHRNFLVERGLNAFVTDNNIVNVNWLFSNAIGGVKVQIPQKEVVKYREITNAHDFQIEVNDDVNWQHHETDLSTCPKCDSIEIFEIKWPKRLIFLTLLLFGFPVPIYAKTTICDSCGYEILPKFDVPKQFRLIHLFILMIFVAIVLGVSVQLGVNWIRLVSIPAIP